MKGTLGKKEDVSDSEAIHTLKNNAKEKSENVMIVDLVRNDMSKIASKNSVDVPELFDVYSFPRVYQMISTVTADLKKNTSMFDILKALFPMGSMTGAPKRKAMELIHEYEMFQRGPFSGAVGYIDPEGNFDFSVLIRSVFYDQQQLYFSAGSAITVQSQVDFEYNECLMKASAIFDVINEYNNNATHR
jgi:para-aminobenzoate synthetase component 1